MGVNHDANGCEHHMNIMITGRSGGVFGVHEGSWHHAHSGVEMNANLIENV